jgi:hypothetical protein
MRRSSRDAGADRRSTAAGARLLEVADRGPCSSTRWCAAPASRSASASALSSPSSTASAAPAAPRAAPRRRADHALAARDEEQQLQPLGSGFVDTSASAWARPHARRRRACGSARQVHRPLVHRRNRQVQPFLEARLAFAARGTARPHESLRAHVVRLESPSLGPGQELVHALDEEAAPFAREDFLESAGIPTGQGLPRREARSISCTSASPRGRPLGGPDRRQG